MCACVPLSLCKCACLCVTGVCVCVCVNTQWWQSLENTLIIGEDVSVTLKAGSQ